MFYSEGYDRMLVVPRTMTTQQWRDRQCLTDVRPGPALSFNTKENGCSDYSPPQGATLTETCQGKRLRIPVTNFKRTFSIKVNVKTVSSPGSCIC